MSSFSIFKKKQPEATSVAEALAGTAGIPSSKSKKRKSESRNSEAQDEQLVPERKRARRRLIGAVAMVLAVIIGLPMVLDSEPKPSGRNIVIQIPSKDVPSVSVDSNGVAQTGTSRLSSKAILPSPDVEPVSDASSPTPATPAMPATNAAVTESTSPATKTDTKDKSESVAKKEVLAKTKEAEPKSADQTAEQRPRNPDESTRAMAILDGKETTKNAAAKPGAAPQPSASSKTPTRIVVQIGAFATQEKVNELKGKLESAGIKFYTQKVATSSGDKIRVRLGPFSDKESAEQVKKKLEKIGLTGSLITL